MHQHSLPRHSKEETAAPCLSCIISVLLCFLFLAPTSFSWFVSCNSLLLTFSCWAFGFVCRFIKAACMNAVRRHKAPADPLNISRLQLAREGELAPKPPASKLPWPCPTNGDPPCEQEVSVQYWALHRTGLLLKPRRLKTT